MDSEFQTGIVHFRLQCPHIDPTPARLNRMSHHEQSAAAIELPCGCTSPAAGGGDDVSGQMPL